MLKANFATSRHRQEWPVSAGPPAGRLPVQPAGRLPVFCRCLPVLLGRDNISLEPTPAGACRCLPVQNSPEPAGLGVSLESFPRPEGECGQKNSSKISTSLIIANYTSLWAPAGTGSTTVCQTKTRTRTAQHGSAMTHCGNVRTDASARSFRISVAPALVVQADRDRRRA